MLPLLSQTHLLNCGIGWHGLLQLKVLYRLQLSASKMANLYPGLDLTCIRCKHNPANLGNMFWFCRKLTVFWTGIFNTVSNMCNKVIRPNPLTAVFEVIPQETPITRHQAEGIAFSALLTQHLMLLNWMKVTSPSHRHWVEEAMSHLKLEQLKYTARVLPILCNSVYEVVCVYTLHTYVYVELHTK